MKQMRVLAALVSAALCITMVAVAEEASPGIPDTDTPRVECANITITVSNDDADPWWGNRGVAYGAYLQFEPAQIQDRPQKARVFDPIYFDLDKSVLRPDGIATAEILLAYLQEHPGARVRLEGNCCDLAPDDYNIRLGQRRADAVKKYLVDRGIDPDRVETVTFGKRRLVTTDPANRPANRRVDPVIAK
jgi:outer membrane protein OmpA-like peptidoglycan-associated protein